MCCSDQSSALHCELETQALTTHLRWQSMTKRSMRVEENGIRLVLPLIFSQSVSLCLRFRFIGFQGCEMWNPRGEILGEGVHNADNS